MKNRARRTFWRSMTAGLLLTLGVIIGAIWLCAMNEGLFERALLESVDSSLGFGETELRDFANDTIDYLSGRLPTWQPTVQLDGEMIGVPPSFVEHMASVKSGLELAEAAALFCLVLSAVLLAIGWLRGRGGLEWLASRSPELRERTIQPGLSRRAYYLGAAIPLAATLALCGWAAIDFNGFWSWLHHAFIRGGIFDANEPIMQLFPLSLFTRYLWPVAGVAAVGLAAVALLPIVYRAVRAISTDKGQA